MLRNIIRLVYKITDIKKGKLILLILFNFFSSLIFIIYLWLIKDLINYVIKRKFNEIVYLAVFMIIVVLMNILLNRAIALYTNQVYMQTEIKMSTKFYEKLNRVYLSEIDKYAQADIITRFNDDIKSIIDFQLNILISDLSKVVKLIMILLYIGLNNMYLLIFVIVVPIIIIIPKYYGKKSGDEYLEVQKAKSSLNMVFKDIIDYVDDIRIYLANDYFGSSYIDKENTLVQHELKKTFYDNMVWVAGVIGYQAIYVLLYVVGGFLAFYNLINFGLIVSTFTIIDPMVDMFMGLPGIIPDIYSVKNNVDRYNEVMNLKDMPDKGDNCKIMNEYSIVYNNVSYKYKNGSIALDNISLNFNSKEKIAVIGVSGSGKSTLLKLLMGYDSEYNGSLVVDSLEIKKINSNTIKKFISFLPQDVFLQSDTIENNIKAVCYDYNREDLYRFAKIAEINDEIIKMNNGYHTMMENGGENISVGQKQRLGILMALIKKKPLLVLDEYFSAIDTQAEQKILNNIFSQLECGVLLVTHRISDKIMCKFDKIVLMDNGRIVACDNYDNMAKNPLYKSMIKESTI